MSTDKIPPSQFHEIDSRLQELDVYRCFKSSKYLSFKRSSYFQVYEELLARYKGKKITFVEIGVLNGGSLYMWRSYFGPEARIIGIDFNPTAKKWEKDGFEIYIGNQADTAFWDELFSSVGDVDVILDDGGHTNEQQIITAHKCIPHIRDSGMLIVEDTHTSYFKEFGNPSKYSFINYSKTLIDSINSRFPEIHASDNSLNKAVYSMHIYESIVCFNIDRAKCFVGLPISNQGISFNAEDFRHHGSSLSKAKSFLALKLKFLQNIGLINSCAIKLFELMFSVKSKLQSAKLKKYFH